MAAARGAEGDDARLPQARATLEAALAAAGGAAGDGLDALHAAVKAVARHVDAMRSATRDAESRASEARARRRHEEAVADDLRRRLRGTLALVEGSAVEPRVLGLVRERGVASDPSAAAEVMGEERRALASFLAQEAATLEALRPSGSRAGGEEGAVTGDSRSSAAHLSGFLRDLRRQAGEALEGLVRAQEDVARERAAARAAERRAESLARALTEAGRILEGETPDAGDPRAR